jgi:hypothetical protein
MERLEHEFNMKKAQQKLSSSKRQDYTDVKNKEKEIEDSLQEFRRDESERKKLRKREIREYEKTQRANVRDYLNNKRREAHKSDGEDSLKFSRIQEERKRQLEELSKL